MKIEDLKKGMRFGNPEANISVRDRNNWRWKTPEVVVERLLSRDGTKYVYYRDNGGNRYKVPAEWFVSVFGQHHIEATEAPTPQVQDITELNPLSIPYGCPWCGFEGTTTEDYVELTSNEEGEEMKVIWCESCGKKLKASDDVVSGEGMIFNNAPDIPQLVDYMQAKKKAKMDFKFKEILPKSWTDLNTEIFMYISELEDIPEHVGILDLERYLDNLQTSYNALLNKYSPEELEAISNMDEADFVEGSPEQKEFFAILLGQDVIVDLEEALHTAKKLREDYSDYAEEEADYFTLGNKTSFNKYLEKEMKNPKMKEKYIKARKEINFIDSIVKEYGIKGAARKLAEWSQDLAKLPKFREEELVDWGKKFKEKTKEVGDWEEEEMGDWEKELKTKFRAKRKERLAKKEKKALRPKFPKDYDIELPEYVEDFSLSEMLLALPYSGQGDPLYAVMGRGAQPGISVEELEAIENALEDIADGKYLGAFGEDVSEEDEALLYMEQEMARAWLPKIKAIWEALPEEKKDWLDTEASNETPVDRDVVLGPTENKLGKKAQVNLDTIVFEKYEDMKEGKKVVFSDEELDRLPKVIEGTPLVSEEDVDYFFDNFVTIPNPNRVGIKDAYIGYFKE